jgi:Flp pilus assembly protein TadD
MNDEDNAFSDFNMAIKLDGKNAEAWSNQALIYERRGDKVKASKAYREAVHLDPTYQPAKDGLSRTSTAAAG